MARKKNLGGATRGPNPSELPPGPVREAQKKYLDDNTLVKKFNEYVYEKMQSQNISSKLIDQYYAANPPYMSVSGLKRYWDKYGK